MESKEVTLAKDLSPELESLISKINFKDALNTGEWALQVTMLDLAFRDLESKDKSERYSALYWFYSEKTNFLSFKCVCELLGLNPYRIRQFLVH